MMENLLWAAGGAAVVYVLFVRPLQQAPRGDAGDAEAGGGMTAADLAGGSAGLRVGGAAASKDDCGCGGAP